MRELDGTVVTPEGLMPGRIAFDRRILSLSRDDSAPAGAPFILPGFIDLHVHGGGGADAMRGEADVRAMAAFHALHGTTAMLPTTVTAPETDLMAAADGIGRAFYASGPGEARVLGMHLEGPFINPKRLGAQPPFCRAPDTGLLQRLLALCPIPVLTFAPELDPELAFLRFGAQLGIRCQIGHSDADAATCAAAIAQGAGGFTHLFNAMRPFHHREAGTAGAALALAQWSEIIPDLQHVAADGLRVALRAVPGLYAITDAIEAAGGPDGSYRLGTHKVVKEGQTVRLEDGTLAGSVLTMDAALRNLVALDLPLTEAARRCSTLAADYLGLTERGRVAIGAFADLVVLDAALQVQDVLIEGEPVP